MKYYLSALIITSALTCQGQDTTLHLSKHSISFTCGVNVIYPTVNQYSEYYNNLIIPSYSTQPWFQLTYNTVYRRTNYSSIGTKVGIGYIQYKYTGVEYDYGTQPWPPVSIKTALQQLNELEINVGFFINEKIFKRIGWYNELGIMASVELYQEFDGAGPNASWSWGNYYPLLNLTNEQPLNLYLTYETGVPINISKNITLTPSVEFLLCNVFAHALWLNGNAGQENAFSTIRTGIMFTYNFKGK
jgi:hypothetical protein